MRGDSYLALNYNFSQTDGADTMYKKPTFEQTDIDIDWENPVFHEPRAFTIKNIRDIFFSLLNQSQA